MTKEEVQRYLGQRVTLRLTLEAPGGPTITGRLTGTLEAADGLVVFLEPDDAPGKRVSFHYHHIADVSLS